MTQRAFGVIPVLSVQDTPWFQLWRNKSYDILDQIWRSGAKKVRGLYALGDIAEANGLGKKTGHGAQAPRDWKVGKRASVINYCQHDVYLTKALFELILSQGFILRGDGRPIFLPKPEGF